MYNGACDVDVIRMFESSKYDRNNFVDSFYNVSDVNVVSFEYNDIIDHAYQ